MCLVAGCDRLAGDSAAGADLEAVDPNSTRFAAPYRDKTIDRVLGIT
jgi:hypothetical protein